jgi:hypothetical protein
LAPAAKVAEGCTAAAILEIGIMDVTQRYNNGLKSHSKIPNPKRQTNAKAIMKIQNPKSENKLEYQNSIRKTRKRERRKRIPLFRIFLIS